MDKLQGPISLVELYSNIYNKHIYVFGDQHTKEGKCKNNFITIVDFLKQYNNKMDFYIEYPFIKDEKLAKSIYESEDSDSYINDIMNEYKECFSKDKKTCKTRLHYIDMRQAVYIDPITNRNTQDTSLYYLYMLGHGYDSEYDSYDKFLGYMTNLKKVIKDKGGLLSFIKYILSVTKIQKQIDSIKKEYSKKDYTKIRISIYKHIIVPFIDTLIKLLKLESRGINGELTDDFHIEIKDNLVSMSIDAYTISRIFRKFDNENKNIVIYTGDIHSQRYISILKDMNFDVLFESKSDNESLSDFQCLDISKLKQPLFT